VIPLFLSNKPRFIRRAKYAQNRAISFVGVLETYCRIMQLYTQFGFTGFYVFTDYELLIGLFAKILVEKGKAAFYCFGKHH
jgi:hypothetical protein